MKLPTTKTESVTTQPPAKFPLFTEWMDRNRELTGLMPESDWFHFFQSLLKTLKTRNRWFINQYSEKVLPGLVDNRESLQVLREALRQLRMLLITNIQDNPRMNASQRTVLFRELLSLFDQIFVSVETAHAREQSHQSATTAPLDKTRINRLRYLAYEISASRFEGRGYYNGDFLQWTGIRCKSFPANLDWETLIHPDDYPRIISWFQQKVDANQHFYMMNYRLKNKQNDWHHMYDFGRITYNEAGEVMKCTGILVEANTSMENFIQEFELPGVFECLMDDANEYAFVLDRNGRMVYATHLLLTHLNLFPGIQQLQEGQAWNNLSTPFFELLDSENKATAEKVWQTLLNEPYVSTTMQLHLKNGKQIPEREVEFYCYPVQKPFQKSLYIFLGQVLSEDSPVFLQQKQQQKLVRLNQELLKLTDIKSFYSGVISLAMELLPNSDAAAFLVKTPSGLVLKSARGFRGNPPKDDVVISRSVLTRLKQHPVFASVGEDVQLVPSGEIKTALLSVLPENEVRRLEKQFCLTEAANWLIGGLHGHEKTFGVLVVGVLGDDKSFTRMDRQVLELLLLQASSTVKTLLLYRKLHEIEATYRTLIEKSSLTVMILQNDQIKLFNPAYLELTGLTYEQAMEVNFWQLIHPTDAQALMNKFNELREGAGYCVHEFRIAPPGQTEIPCQGVFMHIEYNQKPAILCEITDLSYLHELEQELIKAKKLENIGLLTTGIAHDFNNLLAAIIPSAQMLLRNATTPELRKYARNIVNLAKRAGHISRQLTTYAHTDGEFKEWLDLNRVLEDTRELLKNLVGPNVRIEYHLAKSLPQIYGERNQLLQMLINLIINAGEAMPEGGTIMVSTQTQLISQTPRSFRNLLPGQYVVLTVRDNGKGIAENIHNKIFEPFLTTRETARGTHLGLSMVYGISQKHEGYVSVQSEADKGTTFKVFLPADTENAYDERQDSEQKGNPQTTGKILVVDDEEYLRDVLTSMLNLMGYSYLEASSGKEAIEIYRKHQDEIDTVILDYMMTGMSGEKTFYALKEINPNLKIILCTGYTDQREIAPLLKQPAVSFLPKPVTLESLSKQLTPLSNRHP